MRCERKEERGKSKDKRQMLTKQNSTLNTNHPKGHNRSGVVWLLVDLI